MKYAPLLPIFTLVATLITALPAVADECKIGLTASDLNFGNPFSFVMENARTEAIYYCDEAADVAAGMNKRHNNGDGGRTPVEAKVYLLVSEE